MFIRWLLLRCLVVMMLTDTVISAVMGSVNGGGRALQPHRFSPPGVGLSDSQIKTSIAKKELRGTWREIAAEGGKEEHVSRAYNMRLQRRRIRKRRRGTKEIDILRVPSAQTLKVVEEKGAQWHKKVKNPGNTEDRFGRLGEKGVYRVDQPISNYMEGSRDRMSRRKLLYSSLNSLRGPKSQGRISWVGRIGIILGPNIHDFKRLRNQLGGSQEGEWEGEALGLEEKEKLRLRGQLEGEWEGDGFLGMVDEDGGVDEGDEKDDDDEIGEFDFKQLPTNAQIGG